MDDYEIDTPIGDMIWRWTLRILVVLAAALALAARMMLP